MIFIKNMTIENVPKFIEYGIFEFFLQLLSTFDESRVYKIASKGILKILEIVRKGNFMKEYVFILKKIDEFDSRREIEENY